jgi:hypothetical protein
VGAQTPIVKFVYKDVGLLFAKAAARRSGWTESRGWPGAFLHYARFNPGWEKSILLWQTEGRVHATRGTFEHAAPVERVFPDLLQMTHTFAGIIRARSW